MSDSRPRLSWTGEAPVPHLFISGSQVELGNQNRLIYVAQGRTLHGGRDARPTVQVLNMSVSCKEITRKRTAREWA
jgi:hypothetical protein